MDVIFGLVVGVTVGAVAIGLDRLADRWRERSPSDFQRRGLIRWLLDRRRH